MKDFLRKLFPFISTAATVVGGPLGASAAAALGKALGSDKDNPTVDDLVGAYGAATPEQRLAARQAEQEFALKMQEAGFKNAEELERIASADRDSARRREIAVKDRIPGILAIAITVGFFGLLGVMMKWAPPTENKDLLNIMLGSLGAAWIAVVTYYFGSSAGSAKKDSIIANGKGNGH